MKINLLKLSLVLVTLFMVNSKSSVADDDGSMIECRTRCWGGEQAAQKIIEGIEEVLQQKKDMSGAYQKKYEYLKDRLKNTKRNFATMHLLETDPVSGMPYFSIMLIKNSIAKKTSAGMCFNRCGSFREGALKSTEFMYDYFMNVIVSLGMDNLKKAFIYRGTPFDTINVQKMLDKVVKSLPEDKFKAFQEKSKDDQLTAFLKNVRLGKDSFTKLRPE